MADEKTTKETPAPVKKGMPVCSCRCFINKNTDVPLNGVTPAEMLYLVASHNPRFGGNPIKDVKETGVSTATPSEEVARLKGKYVGKKVTALFSGAIPQLPQTFDEAQKLGMELKIPTARLVE